MSTSQGESSLPVKSLLDLPVEIQTQIYHQYYAKPWTFYAQDYHFNAIQPRGQHPNPFMTNPSINLLLTCRAINEIASPVLPASYKNIVSLVAVEKFNEYREWDVFLSTCQKFLAPATIFHIRLDQAEHFSGWDLIHKLQDMEAQNFKTVVMEDHFVVKKKRSVFGRHDKGQMRRIPFSFIERVVEGRYMTAEPWGMDTWRRDYNSHHLLYPIHHRYLLRFRVDQSALCNKIFEVELELTTRMTMDMPWKEWLVLRENVREIGIYAEESQHWEVLDLDNVKHYGYRYEVRPPIHGALAIGMK